MILGAAFGHFIIAWTLEKFAYKYLGNYAHKFGKGVRYYTSTPQTRLRLKEIEKRSEKQHHVARKYFEAAAPNVVI
jgi:hypothetical protein